MKQERCPICSSSRVGGEEHSPECRCCMKCGAIWTTDNRKEATLINDDGEIVMGSRAREYYQESHK